jgi:uncharacterized membrane protein
MKKIILPLTVLGIVIFAACSHKATPGKTETTTNTPPPPKYVPVTFADNVQALIQAKCSPCHTPSKGGNKANFENYENSKKWAAQMIAKIELMPGSRGFMPMKGAKLPDDEIAVFKNWLKDGLLEKNP